MAWLGVELGELLSQQRLPLGFRIGKARAKAAEVGSR
jgi:hypothetical protein